MTSNDILEAIYGRGKFSLLNDETTNTFNIPQLSVCLRFVDRGLKRETF